MLPICSLMKSSSSSIILYSRFSLKSLSVSAIFNLRFRSLVRFSISRLSQIPANCLIVSNANLRSASVNSLSYPRVSKQTTYFLCLVRNGFSSCTGQVRTSLTKDSPAFSFSSLSFSDSSSHSFFALSCSSFALEWF